MERTLRHHMETHGLVFSVDLCGQRVHGYELKPPSCQLLGVKVTEEAVSFGVKYNETCLKFSASGARRLVMLGDWQEKAFENLSTETCKDYRVIPDSVIFNGGPSEWEATRQPKRKIAA